MAGERSYLIFWPEVLETKLLTVLKLIVPLLFILHVYWRRRWQQWPHITTHTHTHALCVCVQKAPSPWRARATDQYLPPFPSLLLRFRHTFSLEKPQAGRVCISLPERSLDGMYGKEEEGMYGFFLKKSIRSNALSTWKNLISINKLFFSVGEPFPSH